MKKKFLMIVIILFSVIGLSTYPPVASHGHNSYTKIELVQKKQALENELKEISQSNVWEKEKRIDQNTKKLESEIEDLKSEQK